MTEKPSEPDAEFVETRAQAVAEICEVFGLPPRFTQSGAWARMQAIHRRIREAEARADEFAMLSLNAWLAEQEGKAP